MKLNRLFSFALVPLIGLLAGHQAEAYTLPEGLGASPVADAGYPGFGNTADLTFTKTRKGYQLTATLGKRSPFEFSASPDDSWEVKGTFKLVANFDRKFEFNPKGSSVSIAGRIMDYDGDGEMAFKDGKNRYDVMSKGLLYKADLLDFAVDSEPGALGFTTDASDDKGWATQFMTENESVWFFGQDVWQQIMDKVESATKKRPFRSLRIEGVQAVTTVPVPAAVWLFGSALAGLMASGRRKGKGDEAASC